MSFRNTLSHSGPPGAAGVLAVLSLVGAPVVAPGYVGALAAAWSLSLVVLFGITLALSTEGSSTPPLLGTAAAGAVIAAVSIIAGNADAPTAGAAAGVTVCLAWTIAGSRARSWPEPILAGLMAVVLFGSHVAGLTEVVATVARTAVVVAADESTEDVVPAAPGLSIEPDVRSCTAAQFAGLAPELADEAVLATKLGGRNVVSCSTVGLGVQRGSSVWFNVDAVAIAVTALPVAPIPFTVPGGPAPFRSVDGAPNATIVFSEYLDRMERPDLVGMVQSGLLFPLDRMLCGPRGDAVILVSMTDPARAMGLLIREHRGPDAPIWLVPAELLSTWLQFAEAGTFLLPTAERAPDGHQDASANGEAMVIRPGAQDVVASVGLADACG